MSILYLTGFKDFSAPKSTGLVPNPSRLLIEHIERNPKSREALAKLGGYKEVITTLRGVPGGSDFEALRDVSKKSAGRVLSVLEEEDAIINLGQGSFTQRGPVLESRFKNTLNWRNLGKGLIDPRQWANHTVGQGGALNALVEEVQKQHPKLSLGTDAGDFLCNLWGYMAHEAAPGRSLFVHLPGCTSRLMTGTLWAANQKSFREGGLRGPGDMGCPTVEENYAFLKTLVSVWRPFETKSI